MEMAQDKTIVVTRRLGRTDIEYLDKTGLWGSFNNAFHFKKTEDVYRFLKKKTIDSNFGMLTVVYKNGSYEIES